MLGTAPLQAPATFVLPNSTPSRAPPLCTRKRPFALPDLRSLPPTRCDPMKLKLKSRSSRKSRPRGSGRIEEAPSPADSVLVKELTASFKIYDKDGNGKISKSELGEVLRSLGDSLTDSELSEAMASLGGDDGCIDLPQFITFHTSKSGLPRVSSSSSGTGDDEEDDPEVVALKSAFAVFDIDQNGFISAEELLRVMRSLGDQHSSLDECRHMISCVDRDGDQMVDFSEFRGLMSGNSALSF